MMADRLSGADLTDDEEEVELTKGKFKEVLAALLEANRKRDEVMAGRKHVRKTAKVSVELMQMDLVIKMMEWEPQEIRDYISRLLLYMEFADLLGKRPENSQIELFPVKDPDVQSREDWKMRGYLATTLGKGTFGVPPAECPPERHVDWMAGVHEGTADNGKKLKVVK
jgi:hypothetical protein